MIQVLFIAVFAVFFLRDGSAGPWLHGWTRAGVAGATLGSLAAVWLVAHALIWREGRRMDRRGDLRAVGRCDLIQGASRLVAVLIHGAAVLGLGWLDVVRSVVGDLILVDEILASLPVLLVFVGGWWSMFPIDRRLREAVLVRDLDDGRPVHPMPGRGEYVLAAVRHQAALVLLPLLAIVGLNELIQFGAERLGPSRWLPLAALQIVGMALVLTLMPAVLRRVWDTVKLGPGPLREILERMCRDQGVRVRELLVWRTHGTMLNGAVMGLAGPFRYVLLTDALLETLSGPQVEAVMAHELGHVRRRHMIWLGVAGLAGITVAGIAARLALMRVAPHWSQREWVQGAAFLAAIIPAILVFGFVSRRFEWQADAFAVQHLSGYRPGQVLERAVVIEPEAVVAMTSALSVVARLNHIPSERFTFRHGSIASRQRKLRALVGQRADRLATDRVSRAIKWVSGAAFIAALALAARFGVS